MLAAPEPITYPRYFHYLRTYYTSPVPGKQKNQRQKRKVALQTNNFIKRKK